MGERRWPRGIDVDALRAALEVHGVAHMEFPVRVPAWWTGRRITGCVSDIRGVSRCHDVLCDQQGDRNVFCPGWEPGDARLDVGGVAAEVTEVRLVGETRAARRRLARWRVTLERADVLDARRLEHMTREVAYWRRRTATYGDPWDAPEVARWEGMLATFQGVDHAP